MEQQVAVTQEKNSLFKHTLMNPMVRKLDRVTEQDSEHSATYSGIVAKTFLFLLLTGVGAALYFVVHQIFIADAVIEITDYSISLQESGVLLLALLFTALGPGPDLADPSADPGHRWPVLFGTGICSSGDVLH